MLAPLYIYDMYVYFIQMFNISLFKFLEYVCDYRHWGLSQSSLGLMCVTFFYFGVNLCYFQLPYIHIHIWLIYVSKLLRSPGV